VHTWMVVLLAVPALVVYRSLRASLLLQEQLAHQAFHDPLTDLPNRVLFTSRLVEALARAKRADGTVAVLYLDLDGFKQINDSMGHSMGDVLLRVIATRLQENLGPAETVARFGGDEFTALVADKDPAGVVRLAEQLLATVRVPVVSDGQQFSVSGSIGIVLSNGQDSAEVLLRNADIAMYQAKAAGKGRWSIFAPAMYTAVQERVTLERELREAVPHGELRVHYQPTVDLRTNQMVGAEALVRWQHPTRGLLQPDHFIALAEETGLIVPIGRWVLREACHQARRWQTVAPAGDSFSVNVNLSPRQLLEPGLVGEVAAILAETDLSDGALVLEVTESVMMQDADAALCTLRALKTLGVQLALDDFGTGYSSLSYVHRFPFDVLKIDQAFIRGIETNRRDAALVSTIVAMGQSLQLRTVAEGIESAAQAAALAQLGCDTGQGYYFARPLPADVLDVLLRTEQAAAVELGNVRWLPRTRTGSAG
jgi:diguanylate cyclase (GGDEF)-like protein